MTTDRAPAPVGLVGLGLDIVDVDGFSAQLADPASGFVVATFTASERAGAPRDPLRRDHHLAGRFAAKEAYLKAWSSCRWGRPPRLDTVDLRHLEVVVDGYGRPGLRPHGPVAAAMAELGDELGGPLHAMVSISHDGSFASAVVTLAVAARPDGGAPTSGWAR